ncbi:hypothetical protein C8R43DRAFT_310186 [Mycena crocata]|nr:hypothetical protein C8R43DRAFT_310186 [Mycena crocata]
MLALSSSLSTYDLKEKELTDVLIFHWRENSNAEGSSKNQMWSNIKLLSEVAVKEIAINKHGSEAKLVAHLERKQAAARIAYDQRIAEYETAIQERSRLFMAGDAAAAAAVAMPNNKKIPKSRPALPTILRKSSMLNGLYRSFVVFDTGCLSVGAEGVVFNTLVRCQLCVIMENLRKIDDERWTDYSYKWVDPGVMPSELIADHEQKIHYECQETECGSYCQENWEANGANRCDICLNGSAIYLHREDQSELASELACNGNDSESEAQV